LAQANTAAAGFAAFGVGMGVLAALDEQIATQVAAGAARFDAGVLEGGVALDFKAHAAGVDLVVDVGGALACAVALGFEEDVASLGEVACGIDGQWAGGADVDVGNVYYVICSKLFNIYRGEVLVLASKLFYR
jgi:hypothetical protein